MHRDKEKANQLGSVTKHVEWAAAFMHHFPIVSYVYWNKSTMLWDIGAHQHLTGMVLDQAIGFQKAGFTPEDYKALVSNLTQDFRNHPNNPLLRKAELSPSEFRDIWNGKALVGWLEDIRSGISIRDATLRHLN